MNIARPHSLALAIVAAGSTALAAQHDQHKGHHPEGSASAPASKATPSKTTPEMAQMENQMKAMRKRRVEMHGRSVEVRSDGDGRGSDFVVRLPVDLLVVGDKPFDEVKAVRPTAYYRILVVDDNLDSAESLTMLLTIMGHETRTAHDGLEALDVAAAFRPKVMLLDIGMPKPDGVEVCRRIRQQACGKDMVVIVLSGWGQEEDKRRSGGRSRRSPGQAGRPCRPGKTVGRRKCR